LQSIKEEGGGERLFAEPLPRQTKNKNQNKKVFFVSQVQVQQSLRNVHITVIYPSCWMVFELRAIF
jgi:uncharacterized protein (DUF1919 family)